jgi:hypothetical protein
MAIVRSGRLVHLIRPCGFGVGLGLPRAQSLCIDFVRVNVIRDWPCSHRSSGRPSPAGRAAPGRSDSSERDPFGVVGVSREPSPFGVNIGRIDVFRDWLLKSVISGRSGVLRVDRVRHRGCRSCHRRPGVVQGASHRCT